MKKHLLVTVDLQAAETTDEVASILHLVASSLEKEGSVPLARMRPGLAQEFHKGEQVIAKWEIAESSFLA